MGRTRTALLVVPALTTEYFARVYTGAAHAVAADHDFGVVLYPSPEGIGPARDPFASARSALDGVIAAAMATDALAALRGEGLPLVMLDSDPDDPGASRDRQPRHRRRRPAPRGPHCYGLGHRRITHLAAAVDSWTFHVRSATLAEALRGVADAGVRTEPAALSVDGGLRAAHAALTGPGPRPTALLCDDDLVAAGACKAARRLGLRVPKRTFPSPASTIWPCPGPWNRS
ncbi:LacI family transcriptional regulator OS=Streptomyces rimosus subsp. rimosus (strain ATCC /DSM 40260 / JCM 4667 / NRRL 2234) OX=1265868 GN=SRIM_007635 PE=4 SV=1 [Streptomyces rimosus subsp. rimosus]